MPMTLSPPGAARLERSCGRASRPRSTGFGVHRFVPGDHAVPPCILGGIEGLVGAIDRLLDGNRGIQNGDSEGYRDLKRLFASRLVPQVRQFGAQSIDDAAARGFVGAWQANQE